MCGIAGAWQAGGGDKVHLDQSARLMANALAHRGPDDDGVWSDPQSGICLGHRRLAIVDLSAAGHQPMLSNCRRYVLVYNGEIYNHIAVRLEIEKISGPVEWVGRSDTETLLAGIVLWGLSATLQKCTGMFALALWDRRERVLHLARDRMGEKPIYYGWVGRRFAFGSELKALRALPDFDNPVDRDALALFTQSCAVPAPYSIYKDIFKLPPGTVLTLASAELQNRILPEPVAFWSVAKAASEGLANPVASEAEGVSRLEHLLREAVAGQMVADVPLGAFLSGGVDSSTIVALMQSLSSRRVQTFTVGFNESGFDEASYAAAVARHLGTDHHELRVSAADAQSVITTLPTIYDEPFADSSQIPTYLICSAARKNVTVALSGDGGDELFGGYNRYFWGRRIWNSLGWMPLPLRRAFGTLLLAVPEAAWDTLGRATRSVAHGGDKAHKLGRRLKTVSDIDDLYRSLVTEWPRGSGIVRQSENLVTLLDNRYMTANITAPEHRMMLWDMLTYLPDDILHKVDRAGMAVSLETRMPMLDHRVVELAWHLPLAMKIRAGQGKWALRQVLYKHVPAALIERPKAGFAIPVGMWLRGPLRGWAESLLDESVLRTQGYFDAVLVRDKWRQHLSGQHDWTTQLWPILMFQGWLGHADQARVLAKAS
ncbi:MAG: asparagine synthase (glutamine-hydrolyzing) [Myxococcota bacterium]|jgi:asparagine synthase (glutamine-hydrolysing)